MKFFYKIVFIAAILGGIGINNCSAQNFLQKKISVSFTGQPLKTVLASIEKQGGFFFSYNNNLFNTDSLVTVKAKDRPIADVLNLLFKNSFTYRQLNNHVIISAVNNDASLEIKGVVIDRATGNPVPYATVYERLQLVAAMTDEQGVFKLNLKKRGSADSIVVSRVSYKDTIVALENENVHDLKIKVTALDRPLDSVVVSMMAQRDWLTKNILSYKQIINSINLNRFFVKQPFQFSLIPGIGSHGKISSQTVNKFSFNLIGGYNGGVDGLEIGGLYNITNRNVRYVQVAGLFNLVGGHVEGLQIGGLFNKDSSVNGFQAAGIFNNTVKANGFQIAGIINKNDTMQGFQAAAVNINHKFNGVQLGVINIADTIEGIPIGLVNLGKGGINNLSFSYNEMGVAVISYKSGNPKFYNILAAGSTLDMNEKAFAFGYGFGSKMAMGKVFSINPELTSLFFMNGNKAKQNISARLQLNFQFKISKSFSLYAGPAVTALYSKPGAIPEGYKADLSNGMHNFSIAKNTTGWFGWSVGINLF